VLKQAQHVLRALKCACVLASHISLRLTRMHHHAHKKTAMNTHTERARGREGSRERERTRERVMEGECKKS